ncbi:MAG TPA: phosphoglycerate kinase [bacterium]|nr:phosphoglycerate kinase [bacterium]
MKKLTIRDLDLHEKCVLMRVDFNVPMDNRGNITDDLRIQAVMPTIRLALEQRARLVLMSHLGRPGGKVVPELSLKPVAEYLKKLTERPVFFAPDCIGETVEKTARALEPGQILMLENLRFHEGEKKNDEQFARSLARLGDIYANDAFGSAHRSHASVVNTAKQFAVRVAGLLMGKELDFLGRVVYAPKKPFVAILGGAKVADKIPLIRSILPKVDRLLVGGGMAYSFLKAQGKEIGRSILDEAHIDDLRTWLDQNPEKIVLPLDFVVAEKLDLDTRTLGAVQTVSADRIPSDRIGVDVGPRTIELFEKACKSARTVIWNGPMGVFEIEGSSRGTMDVARLLSKLHDRGATTVVGGGDSALAMKVAGLIQAVSHISTGGGAALEFLQGKELPGVSVLCDAE